jgi:DNA-binding NtrC family response regulator
LTAQSGMDAFELLALHQVQVILCDQRMPGMSGIEFLGKVKEMYPDTVRIMLTGHADLESVIDAVNRGHIYRFFTKPWDDQILVDTIRDAFHHYWLQHGIGGATPPAEEADADLAA